MKVEGKLVEFERARQTAKKPFDINKIGAVALSTLSIARIVLRIYIFGLLPIQASRPGHGYLDLRRKNGKTSELDFDGVGAGFFWK